jgi:hypothetical protein
MFNSRTRARMTCPPEDQLRRSRRGNTNWNYAMLSNKGWGDDEEVEPIQRGGRKRPVPSDVLPDEPPTNPKKQRKKPRITVVVAKAPKKQTSKAKAGKAKRKKRQIEAVDDEESEEEDEEGAGEKQVEKEKGGEED